MKRMSLSDKHRRQPAVQRQPWNNSMFAYLATQSSLRSSRMQT